MVKLHATSDLNKTVDVTIYPFLHKIHFVKRWDDGSIFDKVVLDTVPRVTNETGSKRVWVCNRRRPKEGATFELNDFHKLMHILKLDILCDVKFIRADIFGLNEYESTVMVLDTEELDDLHAFEHYLTEAYGVKAKFADWKSGPVFAVVDFDGNLIHTWTVKDAKNNFVDRLWEVTRNDE